MSPVIEFETDYEMLQYTFGEEYFILDRIIKRKIILSQSQKQELEQLIEERNHFDILWFVNLLRN